MSTPKISSATANFASTYKYKIAGKADLFFSSVGSLIKDDLSFKLFRSSRLNDVVRQETIKNSTTLSDSEKKVAAGEAKAAFLSSAFRTVRAAITDKTSPKVIIKAYAQISNELLKAVTSYIEGRGGSSAAVSGEEGVIVDLSEEASGFDAAQDQKFLNNVELMVKNLKKLLLEQKGLLRASGTFFSFDEYQSGNKLDKITAALNAFKAAPAAAPEPEAAAPEPEGVDIEA